MVNFVIPKSLIDLIHATMPETVGVIHYESSLSALIKITEKWVTRADARVHVQTKDPFSPFLDRIIEVEQALGLWETKYPQYPNYHAAIILGATGLSIFMMLKDLIFFHQEREIKFSKIFLLGGDRPLGFPHDNLDIAYQYYPQDFKREPTEEEIFACKNEMQLMEYITSIMIFPDSWRPIPIISVFARKPHENSQQVYANTHDTLVNLMQAHALPTNEPLLFIGTLPYVFRQCLQVMQFMPDHMVDFAATSHPYLETINTPMKGKLPPSIYLDELHWLLVNIAKMED